MGNALQPWPVQCMCAVFLCVESLCVTFVDGRDEHGSYFVAIDGGQGLLCLLTVCCDVVETLNLCAV